jgi:hypothetical protein
MQQDDEESAAKIATEVLKPQVKQLLETPYSPEQIVVAFLTVAYDLFRTDAADRPHFEPVEAFHKLARGTAREFEKLRQPPPPRRATPAKWPTRR